MLSKWINFKLINCHWIYSLQWLYYECNDVSNHQCHERLINLLFRRRSKKTSKLHVSGLCGRNSSVTGEFPHKGPVTQKFFSIWCHHVENCMNFIQSCWLIDSMLDPHWLRWWVIAWSAPKYYLKQCRFIVNWILRKTSVKFESIQENLFENNVHKMAAILSWP